MDSVRKTVALELLRKGFSHAEIARVLKTRPFLVKYWEDAAKYNDNVPREEYVFHIDLGAQIKIVSEMLSVDELAKYITDSDKTIIAVMKDGKRIDYHKIIKPR